MAKLQIYSAKGTKSGTMDLPKEYAAQPNAVLLAQANYVYEDRSHKGTSKVKTRSEVHGTTAKMYRQKGTGNARHGDRKAPIFKGGGVAHGPHGVKRVLTLPKKVAKKALGVSLNMKVKEGKVVVVDKLESITKTKEAQKLLNFLAKETGMKEVKNIFVAFARENKISARFFRNIKDVKMGTWRSLHSYDVVRTSLLVVEKNAFSDEKHMDKKETSGATKTTLATNMKSPAKKTSSKKPSEKTTKAKATKKNSKTKAKTTKKPAKTKKGTKK